MNKILEFKNISKSFGKIEVIKNISLSIEEGERVGIVGANGAGKTTFAEMIIGTSKPSSGEIKYNFKYNKTPQEKMGMQFQDSSYPEGLSTKDIIDFSLEIYGNNINQKKLNEMLDIFQIKSFYKKPAQGLSGGQQQKLNVMLAVAHNPKIVILDEISTGLDIAASNQILSYVHNLIQKNKITTFLISHHMSEIEKICDRLIVLQKGDVLYDGKVKTIKTKYGSLDKYMEKIILKELSESEDK